MCRQIIAKTIILVGLCIGASFAGATTEPATRPVLPPENVALSYAIKQGNVELVKKIINGGTSANSGGASPLWWASVYGRTEIAKVLLDHGANPDSCESGCETTALIAAAIQNNPEIVELLLRAGAKEHLNQSLRSAAARGYRKVVILLLDAGANPNWKEDDGKTAIEMAARRHPDIADLMRHFNPKS